MDDAPKPKASSGRRAAVRQPSLTPAAAMPRAPTTPLFSRAQILSETASVTRSIANAVMLKEGDLFFLTEPGGFVPVAGPHGLGLYYRDCRYLNGYELEIAGVHPDALVSSTAHGYMAVSQLTIPDLLLDDGRLLSKESLELKHERIAANDRLALYDVITFRNYGFEPVVLPITLTLQSAFEDIFTVRGMSSAARGTIHPPQWNRRSLTFVYDGADGIQRRLTAYFSQTPRRVDGTRAYFRVRMRPRSATKLVVSLVIAEAMRLDGEISPPLEEIDVGSVQAYFKRASDAWVANETVIHSSSLALNTVLDRSLRDLRVLRSRIESHDYFAAGVPWFGALFGRDSLITAIQMLAYNPGIAEQTLRLLARYQGQRDDPWRDEQPGKILHELRQGEMARTGEIPHTPYYGTIDATPLFLALIGFHAQWTGSLALFHELRPHIDRALDWIAVFGDRDGDGYLEYVRKSEAGLDNQGWRDSWDGIPEADGGLAQAPIALCEVQGYVYLAKRLLADLFSRAGEPARAEQLAQEARELKYRFNRDFWLKDQGYYALALQADKRPVRVLSSNAGQVLWSGIADPEKAERTMERLLSPAMYSGWGVRTLSAQEVRFNPTGYHLGTVWPHDNSIIAAGFRRYGFSGAAGRIFQGIVEAALHFPDHRLPELFMGFDRQDYGVPVSYPVACRPQAWAAGAVPYLLRSLLGLTAEGFDQRLRIVHPVLPEFMRSVEVQRLRVGGANVDLRFEQSGTGPVAVEVLRLEGRLEVVMELGVVGRHHASRLDTPWNGDEPLTPYLEDA
jgi:glycogen debranching enzyme